MYLYREMTKKQVAETMLVSEKSVQRYVHLFNVNGNVSEKQQRNGPSRKLSEVEELSIMQSLLRKPNLFLDELNQELMEVTGCSIDRSTLCRTVKHLGFTHKKIRHIATQQSEVKHAQFMAEMNDVDPDMLVWVDETGSDRRNAIRKYGYGLRGMTPIVHSLLARGKRMSAVGVMSTRGVEDSYLIEGNVNTDAFVSFVENALLPILQLLNGSNPRSIVIMDNASIHHVDRVCQLIESTGAIIRFLPPYSPDMNPLEEVFSKVRCSNTSSHGV